MQNYHQTLIKLVSLGCDITKSIHIPEKENWKEIFKEAEKQGVLPLAIDGFQRLAKTDETFNHSTSTPYKLTLLGKLLGYEKLYTKQLLTLRELIRFYRKHHIKVMVLKGYGLSLYYPTPAHRTCGDIDIYVFGDIDQGDHLLEEKGINIHRDNNHHSTFNFNGIMIENHRTLLDITIHKSNRRLEQVFTHLLKSPQDEIEIQGETLYRPSATLNAIHLIRHAGGDFVFGKIVLRQIVDICLFFKSEPTINWEYVLHLFHKERMMPFYNAVATIATKTFGVQEQCFAGYEVDYDLANKVLCEIFENKDTLNDNPPSIWHIGTFISYCYSKTKVLFKNRWKFKMVYNESMIKMFWTLMVKRIKND